MFVRDWYRPSFWRWWWHNRAPLEARAALVVLLAGVVAVAGYLCDGLLAPAEGAGIYTVVSTVRALERVEETVTRRGDDRLVTVRTRVVVTLPTRARVVRSVVPHYVTETTQLVREITVAVGDKSPGPGGTVTVRSPAVTVVRTSTVTPPVAPVATRVITRREQTPGQTVRETVTDLQTVTTALTRTVPNR